ncbi:MAG: hypothetical protein AB1791_04605 [Chloroflexota bacterium]
MNLVRTFNPNKVAYYEKAGWEAYYDHQWGRAFRLMVGLNREEFGMPFGRAFLAALDIVRASIAFAPKDNDVPRARHFIERFYQKARRSVGMKAAPTTLADLELDYWIVHRQLALRRIQNQADDDIEPMIESLTRLHAALFDSTPEQMRSSAEWRALAAKAVDRITGRYSNDVAADWREVESSLQKAYQAVVAAG